MSFVRVDRVEDVRVRFHRFPQLCVGKSTGELVEVEERFLVRRGAFERRSPRRDETFLPSFLPRACFFLSNPAEVVPLRSFVAWKNVRICSKNCLRPGTKAMARENIFFFKICLPFFFVVVPKNRPFLGANSRRQRHHHPTTTTREDLRVPTSASRSSRFVSLDFRARAPKRRVTAVTAVVYSKRF